MMIVINHGWVEEIAYGSLKVDALPGSKIPVTRDKNAKYFVGMDLYKLVIHVLGKLPLIYKMNVTQWIIFR